MFILQAAFEQRFCISSNRRQRGADFMRHIGDEIPLDAFEFLGRSDIVQDGYGAARGRARQRNGMDIEGGLHSGRRQLQALTLLHTRIHHLLHDLE